MTAVCRKQGVDGFAFRKASTFCPTKTDERTEERALLRGTGRNPSTSKRGNFEGAILFFMVQYNVDSSRQADVTVDSVVSLQIMIQKTKRTKSKLRIWRENQRAVSSRPNSREPARGEENSDVRTFHSESRCGSKVHTILRAPFAAQNLHLFRRKQRAKGILLLLGCPLFFVLCCGPALAAGVF